MLIEKFKSIAPFFTELIIRHKSSFIHCWFLARLTLKMNKINLAVIKE